MTHIFRPIGVLLAITSWLLVASFAIQNHVQAQETAQSSRSSAEIETIVRDYILKNPEIIVEALQLFEQKQEFQRQEQQKELISRNRDILLSSTHQTILGNPDGDVTLVEFFDYNCGFCRRSLEDIERLVNEDSNLRVVLKEFPVLGTGSQEAARVAIAASKIDPAKYLELHKNLLKARGEVNERVALLITEELGFDMTKIREQLAKPIVNEAINEVYGIATELGLNGTPTFIIGNEVMPGAVGYEVLHQKLSSMRRCGETICS